MRKNLGNKQVIRAITIGISAIMAITPATAFAAEGDNGDGQAPQPNNVIPAKTDEEKAVETATDAGKATSDASVGVATVLDAADKITDTTGTTTPATTPTDALIPTSPEPTTTDTTAKDDDIKKAADELGEEQDDINTAKDKLTGVENNGIVDGAKENLDVANDAKEKAVDAINDAAQDMNDADKLAKDTEADMKKASDSADKAVLTISTATSVAGANAAKQDFDQILADAKTKFDTNQKKYDELNTDFQNQLKAIQEAELKYNEALVNAGSDVSAAKLELDDAKKKADALKTAADEAAKLMTKDAAIMIIEAQKTRDSDAKTNWTHCDNLFKLIVANYYGPVCQKMTGITVDNFTKFKNSENNYVVVTGKDENGNDVKKYLNYKVDENNQLIIFEKSQDVYTGNQNEKAGFVYLNGQEVIELENNGSLQALIDSETVVKLTDDKGNVTYAVKKKPENGTEIINPLNANQTATNENRTESYHFDASTGELVKTVTDDVTTITYSSAKIDDTTKYNSKGEAEAAANAAISNLNANDKVLKVSTTIDHDYIVETTYTPVFTISISLDNEKSNNIFDNWAKKEMIDKAEKIIDGNGNFDILACSRNDRLDKLSTKDKRFNYDTVSGNIIISFVPKTLNKEDDRDPYSIILNELTGGEEEKKKIDSKREKYNDEGKEIIFQPVDGHLFQATTHVVSAKYKSDKAEDTEELAKDKAVKDIKKLYSTKDYTEQIKKIIDELRNKFGTETIEKTEVDDILNIIFPTEIKTKEVNKYTYQIDYQEANVSTANQVISTTTWDAAQVLALTNSNYDSNKDPATNSELNDIEKDQGFKDYLKAAEDKKAAYDNLAAKAKTAYEQLEAAKNKVDDLQKQINALEFDVDNDDNMGHLNTLLETAQMDWRKAKDSYDNLTKKATEAKTAYDNVIEKLRVENDNGNQDDNNDDATTPAINPLRRANAVINPNTVPLAAAPGANRTRNAGRIQNVADGRGDNAIIDEEPVALAAEPKKSTQEDEKKIEDEKTPLAAKPIEQKNIFAWWWFLFLAALGVGGYEGNKQFQKKKTAKKTISDGKKNK